MTSHKHASKAMQICQENAISLWTVIKTNEKIVSVIFYHFIKEKL